MIRIKKETILRDLYLALPAMAVYALGRVLYSQSNSLFPDLDVLDPLDRIQYALFFTIPLVIVFLFILPSLVKHRKEDAIYDPIIAPHMKIEPAFIGLLEAILLGFAFFGMILLVAILTDIEITPGNHDLSTLAGPLFTGSIITPLLEEYFYRGVFIAFFLNRKGTNFTAIVTSSIAFGIAHNPTAAPLLILLGLALGLLATRRGLIFSIIAHSIYNGLIIIFR